MQPVSTRLTLTPILLVVLAAASATHAEAQPAVGSHDDHTMTRPALGALAETRAGNGPFSGLLRERVGPALSNRRYPGGTTNTTRRWTRFGPERRARRRRIGALLGLIPDHYDDCEECHDSSYGSIAVGAGIGLLVDLLRNEKHPPAPSHQEDGLRLGVAVSRGAVGFGGRIAWR